MKTALLLILPLILILTGSVYAPLPIGPLKHAQAGSVIDSQETEFPGIVADLTQCRRRRDVLTVKVRVRNTSSKRVRVYWGDPKRTIYLMDEANQKKYFLLKDAAGEWICSGAPGYVPANGSKISWFKFPAPPPEVKEITFILGGCAPFEYIPIEDK